MKSTLLILAVACCLSSCTGFLSNIDANPNAQKAGAVVDLALAYALAKDQIRPADASEIYAAKTIILDKSTPPEERQKLLVSMALDAAVAGGAIDAADKALVEGVGEIILPDKTVAPDGKTVVPVEPEEPTASNFLRDYREVHRAEDVRPAPILGNEPANGLVAYTAQF